MQANRSPERDQQMKSFVRFCLCAVVSLACLETSANVARAQQSGPVSPEVRADTVRRLELARTWIMPKMASFKDEGKDRKVCNEGVPPGKTSYYDQLEACTEYATQVAAHASSLRGVDALMPGFKACAMDASGSACQVLSLGLAQAGFKDYAIAVALLAPLYTGYYTKIQEQPLSVVLSYRIDFSKVPDDADNYHLQITDTSDALALVNKMCLPGGLLEACQVLSRMGINISEEERLKAVAQNQAIERAQVDDEQSTMDAWISASNRPSTGLNALAAALTNAQQTMPTIQETAAQQQTNLQATAAVVQQRQQAQEQTRLAAEQSARAAQATATKARSTPSDTNVSSSSTAIASTPTPNPTSNPQGSYNPYTGTGSGSIQGSCTDMTGSVQGSVKVGSDGWVSGYLTNNSNQALFVSYTFKQNGVPSTAMANSGGTTIQGGQTVGGEGQGLYSTGADKNPPEIYWYAVLESDHQKYGCAHKW
jgi:hypothetical protein